MAEHGAPEPWLLIIDPQRIFADPSSQWASPFFPEAWEKIRALAAHVGPERTVVTRWLPTADRSTSWGEYFEAWPFADVPADDPLYSLIDGAAELTAYPTVDLPTFGKWGAELEQALAPALGEALPRGASVWVTGVSTDCCVVSTVLAGADAGARLVVVEDAVAASTAENGAAALAVMALFPPQVSIASTRDLLG